MYVRDSKRQGLLVRYADNLFFFSLHFLTRLPSDHVVNCRSPWLRAEGKVHFFILMNRIFLSAFFLFPFFFLALFPLNRW